MYTECTQNVIQNVTHKKPLKPTHKNMELFNTTGFDLFDKVQVTLDQETYYGTVIDIKDNKIKVDYTSKTDNKKVIDWFACKFWTKLETQKPL